MNQLVGGIAVVGFAAFCILGLMDLLPPNHVMRTAAVWGGGMGALVFLAMVLTGSRPGAAYMYLIGLAYAAVVGAICAVAVVAAYMAIFDPPPTPAEQSERFKELMR